MKPNGMPETPAECMESPDTVRRIEAASEHAARLAIQRIWNNCWWAANSYKITSPIEIAFYAWWQARQIIDPVTLDLHPQQEVRTAAGRTYRTDFVVIHENKALFTERIVIELDGHAFHERTPEQVSDRNARDRQLLQEGWKLFHFSGSEVTREPQRCVDEVYDYARGLYFEAKANAR